jgi:hypothetical protein
MVTARSEVLYAFLIILDAHCITNCSSAKLTDDDKRTRNVPPCLLEDGPSEFRHCSYSALNLDPSPSLPVATCLQAVAPCRVGPGRPRGDGSGLCGGAAVTRGSRPLETAKQSSVARPGREEEPSRRIAAMGRDEGRIGGPRGHVT